MLRCHIGLDAIRIVAASEVPLVRLRPPRKLGKEHIPDHSQEFHAFFCCGSSPLPVAIKQRANSGVLEVFCRRRNLDEVTGEDILKYGAGSGEHVPIDVAPLHCIPGVRQEISSRARLRVCHHRRGERPDIVPHAKEFAERDLHVTEV